MLAETLNNFIHSTGIVNLEYKSVIMIGVALFFLWLAIKKGFEPLLLVPIAFGMLLSNLPLTGVFDPIQSQPDLYEFQKLQLNEPVPCI